MTLSAVEQLSDLASQNRVSKRFLHELRPPFHHDAVKGGVKVYQWGGVKLYHRAPQVERQCLRCVRAGARRLPEVGWTSGCA